MRAENKFAKIELRNGIVIFTYLEDFITLKVAKECMAFRVEFQNGEDFPVLCDIRKIRLSDEQARFFLSGPGSTSVRALALLTNPYTEAMAKLYLISNPQPIPTKIFRKEMEALNFLKKYK